MAATALSVLGRIRALNGHEAEAVEQLDESQALLAGVDDGELAGDERAQHILTVALVQNFLGQIWLSQGDPGRAARHFSDGLRAGRRASDRVSVLISLFDLALSSMAAGEPTGAAGFLLEGLSVAVEAGDETSVAYYLESLSAVAGQQGNSHRAVRLLSAAAAMLQAKGSGWLHAYVPRAAHDDGLLACWVPSWRCRIRGGVGVGSLRRWQGCRGLRPWDGISRFGRRSPVPRCAEVPGRRPRPGRPDLGGCRRHGRRSLRPGRWIR